MDNTPAKIDEGNTITKSNRLINSSYKLTTVEHQIIAILASMVYPEDKDFLTYKLKITDFMKALGIKNKNKYKDVQNATKQLMRKVFEIRDGNKLIQLSWLSSATYYEGEGMVELCFDPKLKPYFLMLRSNLTRTRLSNVLHLKNQYSFRIYELLKEFESQGRREFTVEELKYLLGIDSLYKMYADFKRKVLLPSQKEISEKTDIIIKFGEVKKGKRVDGLIYSIKSKKKIPVNKIEKTDNTQLTLLPENIE